MEKHRNKTQVSCTGLKLAILMMSFIQMATNASSAILADIAREFPAVSVSVVQYLMTFPNLIVVIISFCISGLTKYFSKRTIAGTGLGLACLAGVLSFLFHGHIVFLYVWAGMLGTGIGLVIPVATSLISDYFTGTGKDAMLGYQTAAANVGSMLMTALGGVLAGIMWSCNYLVYLLAVPGLVLTLLFVPEVKPAGHPDVKKNEGIEKAEKIRKAGKIKIPAFAWKYFAIAAVFMLLFYIGPTNVAMLVAERNTGTAAIAGTAATLLLLGGFIMGLLFGKISARIGENTIPLGFLLLFAGYGMVYLTDSVICLYAAFFVTGTSNTLVLPQCMGQMVTEDKEQSTFLLSAAFAVANLGTFLAPVLTVMAKIMTGNGLAASRFLLACLLGFLMAVLCKISMRKNKNKKNEVTG